MISNAKCDVSVSIIIPCFNSDAYIGRAISSILNQSFSNWELIIVDDGSQNREIEEVTAISHKIRLINLPHLGVSVARNRGIYEAKGKYLMFIDSDDMIAVNTLEKCIHTIEKNSLDAVFYNSETREYDACKIENRKYIEGRSQHFYNKIIDGETFFVESILTGTYIESPCLFMAKTDIVKKYEYPVGIYYEDTVMTTKMLISGELKRVTCIEDSFYIRFARPNSITSSRKSLYHFNSMLEVCSIIVSEISNLNNCSERKCLQMILNSFVFRAMKCADEVGVGLGGRTKIISLVARYDLYSILFKLRVFLTVSFSPVVRSFIRLREVELRNAEAKVR